VSVLAGANTQALHQIGIGPILLLMAFAVAGSSLVSYLYVQFYGRRATGSQLHRAFPLLGIAIAAIFVTIEFSAPLSLGLLAALSLVRFRTPVKEPEEIGFVMLVVAVAIACATFKLAFAGILLSAAFVALTIGQLGGLRLRDSGRAMIVVTVGQAEYCAHRGAIVTILEQRLTHCWLESVSQRDGQVLISFSVPGAAERTAERLTRELNSQVASPRLQVVLNESSGL
jgi:hypothetical protein